MANQGTNKWQATPDDAIKLAALRWFALTLESLSIQIYATDASKYSALESVLRDCVQQLNGVRRDLVADGDTCPPGFVLCGIECAPMCLTDAEASSR